MCIFDPGIHQVPIEVEEKHAADSAAIAAKPVRKTRLDGAASRGSAGDAAAKYSADGFAVKVNGTAVISYHKKCRVYSGRIAPTIMPFNHNTYMFRPLEETSLNKNSDTYTK